jgi:hypothetical protein
VLLAVALEDELVAVAVLELARAVARRQACAQTKDIGYGHTSTMNGDRADRQCHPRYGTP